MRIWWWIVSCAGVAAMLTGCGRAPAPPAPAGGPRVVSTVPAATLNLVLIGAGARLVGVSKYDQEVLPAELKNLPVVGDYLSLNYEQLLGLHPTALVIQIAPNRIEKRLLETCDSHHIELVNMSFDRIADIWPSVRALGKAAGKEAQAEAAIAKAQGELAALEAESKAARERPRVLYLVEGGTMTAAGKGCFVEEMIDLAGGTNAGAEIGPGFPEMNREAMIKLAPEVLLVGIFDGEPAKTNDPRLTPWMSIPMPASRDHRVFLVTDRDAVKSSVDIAEKIRDLSKMIHAAPAAGAADGAGGKP